MAFKIPIHSSLIFYFTQIKICFNVFYFVENFTTPTSSQSHRHFCLIYAAVFFSLILLFLLYTFCVSIRWRPAFYKHTINSNYYIIRHKNKIKQENEKKKCYSNLILSYSDYALFYFFLFVFIWNSVCMHIIIPFFEIIFIYVMLFCIESLFIHALEALDSSSIGWFMHILIECALCIVFKLISVYSILLYIQIVV